MLSLRSRCLFELDDARKGSLRLEKVLSILRSWSLGRNVSSDPAVDAASSCCAKSPPARYALCSFEIQSLKRTNFEFMTFLLFLLKRKSVFDLILAITVYYCRKSSKPKHEHKSPQLCKIAHSNEYLIRGSEGLYQCCIWVLF